MLTFLRSLLKHDDQLSELSLEGVERQRILVELEEIYRLRERMLQEGTKNIALAARQVKVCLPVAFRLRGAAVCQPSVSA